MTETWEQDPAGDELRALIARVLARTAGHHPGIVAEEVVSEVVARYELAPRETGHAELRRNHPERLRHLTYALFRTLSETARPEPEAALAGRILRAFLLRPRGGAPPEAGR